MKILLRMGGLFAMALMIAGCASSHLAGEPHLRVANHTVDITEETTLSAVQKVRAYALMSELAYRKYDASGQVQIITNEAPRTTDKKSINEFESNKERAQGWLELESRLKELQWEFQKNSKLSCGENKTGNLEFDLWINKSRQPPEVVVAFRGTDDSSDWWSNLRGLLFFNRGSDQYARMHKDDFKDEVMDACHKAGPGAVVTATGHSLGGGLAQHLFYASHLWATNQIARVTVFDSSPMTGWHQFGNEEDKTKAMANFKNNLDYIVEKKQWKIPEVMAHKYGFGTMRVNERGEVLAYVRFLFRVFSPEDNFISVLNFNFVKGEAVKQHSMANLAFHLLYYPELPPRITIPGTEVKEIVKTAN